MNRVDVPMESGARWESPSLQARNLEFGLEYHGGEGRYTPARPRNAQLFVRAMDTDAGEPERTCLGRMELSIMR